MNRRADQLAESLAAQAVPLRLGVQPAGANQGRLIDAGVNVKGGLEAGLALARIALAGAGDVSLVAARQGVPGTVDVTVRTDAPVAACLASQYAGWQINVDGFSALGSGPMRAAAGKEALFESIGHLEQASVAVGLLETDKLPTPAVFEHISQATQVPTQDVTLLVAPVTSLAGAVQVVARSVETAMHKLLELGFDVQKVESGFGVAPLPPPSGNSLVAMGRTNDAVLYGSEVTLWVRDDDATLEQIGPQIPSSASKDYGRPFRDIFLEYDCDFYQIDPRLFSPAVVTLINLDSGRTMRFGETAFAVLSESFGNA